MCIRDRNKCDLLEDKELKICMGVLQRLHDGVRIIETAYGLSLIHI